MSDYTDYFYDGARAVYESLPGLPSVPVAPPTSMDRLAELVGDGLEGAPRVANIAITADSARVGVQSGICFFKATNPLARVCFGTGAVCGLAGDFAGRACYRLGKYALKIGNVTDGNVTALVDVSY